MLMGISLRAHTGPLCHLHRSHTQRGLQQESCQIKGYVDYMNIHCLRFLVVTVPACMKQQDAWNLLFFVIICHMKF